MFDVKGWRETIRKLGELYSKNGTARATAQSINGFGKFGGHGPYRFDKTRNDFRFYRDHGVAYYRLAELVAPQAISQWYLGSGKTVGFHTLTGLAAIDWLIGLRDAGKVDFCVWPHETLQPDGERNLLAESYPAICPALADNGPCKDDDQRAAWRVLDFLVTANAERRLPNLFQIEEAPFGQIDGVGFQEQIQFEGFIIGL
jgi:hypothetical protein